MFCLWKCFSQCQAGNVRFQKKTKNNFIIMLRDVYNTALNFLTFFFESQESELPFLIAFFSAEHEYQSHFFLSRPAFPKFCVKSLKSIINIGIFPPQILYN